MNYILNAIQIIKNMITKECKEINNYFFIPTIKQTLQSELNSDEKFAGEERIYLRKQRIGLRNSNWNRKCNYFRERRKKTIGSKSIQREIRKSMFRAMVDWFANELIRIHIEKLTLTCLWIIKKEYLWFHHNLFC